MAVKLSGGKAASAEAIRRLEAELGFPLADPFVDFLRANDGATPASNVFAVGDTNECGVTQFIPAEKILEERKAVEEEIPRTAYPVAWADCGNLVFIDAAQGGAVFFWDHELPEEPTKLVQSFGEFLEGLRPFDLAAVQLKEGQKVLSSWIDPEFLKKFG